MCWPTVILVSLMKDCSRRDLSDANLLSLPSTIFSLQCRKTTTTQIRLPRFQNRRFWAGDTFKLLMNSLLRPWRRLPAISHI